MHLFIRRIADKRYSEDHDSTSLLTIPNAITLLRLALVAPMSLAAFERATLSLVLLLLAFILLDNLDGYLALRLAQRTRFGATFDKVVDAAATFSGFFVAALSAMLPWWVFGILAFKQAVQTAVASLLRCQNLTYPPVYLVPKRLGFGGVTGIAALMAALVNRPALKLGLCLVVSGLLAASLIVMVRESMRLLRRVT